MQLAKCSIMLFKVECKYTGNENPVHIHIFLDYDVCRKVVKVIKMNNTIYYDIYKQTMPDRAIDN